MCNQKRHVVDIILDASSGSEGVTLSASQVHGLAYHITLDAEQIANMKESLRVWNKTYPEVTF